MYNLAREKKPFPSLLFVWKFHQGSYLSPGKAGREENQETEIIDGGGGGREQGKRGPGEAGLNTSDTSSHECVPGCVCVCVDVCMPGWRGLHSFQAAWKGTCRWGRAWVLGQCETQWQIPRLGLSSDWTQLLSPTVTSKCQEGPWGGAGTAVPDVVDKQQSQHGNQSTDVSGAFKDPTQSENNTD